MRNHYCGQLDREQLSQTVSLCGWVHRRRDHGGVIFVDLRDHHGLVQIVFEPEQAELFKWAESLRSEYVLAVEGEVRARPEGLINPNMRSGEIEVLARHLTILNRAETPPLSLDEYGHSSDDLRLQYRYLDLRRPEMQARLRMRAQINACLRSFLDQQQFIEVETPILTKATPEGARDYLVPSRTHRGEFFALPQSPQLFKQLLMMGGMDRYYQIARCFRDEDLRADRQPEFTQLDIETAFLEKHQLQDCMETMVRHLFKTVLAVELPVFPRLTYAEAMRRYGSDKPDLRIPLELVDVGDVLKTVDFKVFATPANDPEGRVAALRLPKGADLVTRKQIDAYTNFVAIYGAKGLAYIKVNDRSQGTAGLQSPIIKFLGDAVTLALLERTGAENGDIIFFGADKINVVNESLGALRLKLGTDHNLFTQTWAPLWVVDFPMFEKTETGFTPLHHPFTAPQVQDPEQLRANAATMLSEAYDMVLNGNEIGGGSIRIHNSAMQQMVFELLNIDEQMAEQKFGFLLEALRYGCPPHGGMAFGLDRIAMLMSGTKTIRDVIAFPKTQSARCLLTDAPSAVEPEQLREVGIRLRQTSTSEAVTRG